MRFHQSGEISLNLVTLANYCFPSQGGTLFLPFWSSSIPRARPRSTACCWSCVWWWKCCHCRECLRGGLWADAGDPGASDLAVFYVPDLQSFSHKLSRRSWWTTTSSTTLTRRDFATLNMTSFSRRRFNVWCQVAIIRRPSAFVLNVTTITSRTSTLLDLCCCVTMTSFQRRNTTGRCFRYLCFRKV